jgi:hypothetical protein
LLTIAAIGHDAYRAYETGNDFAFSQIGGLLQTYARAEHNEMRTAVVDTAGAETFNSVLVPFLSLYTAAFTGSLAAIFGAIYAVKAMGTRDTAPKKHYSR